jgi:hypothetical protein
MKKRSNTRVRQPSKAIQIEILSAQNRKYEELVENLGTRVNTLEDKIRLGENAKLQAESLLRCCHDSYLESIARDLRLIDAAVEFKEPVSTALRSATAALSTIARESRKVTALISTEGNKMTEGEFAHVIQGRG